MVNPEPPQELKGHIYIFKENQPSNEQFCFLNVFKHLKLHIHIPHKHIMSVSFI